MTGLVVLGGGISGISAAFTANALGQRAEVYEAADRWGGLLDHFTIEGFRFDKAVHLSFTEDVYVRSIFDQTPFVKHNPIPMNYEQGRWLKHPVQNNLFPLPVEEKIEAIESFIQRPPLSQVSNYREWLLQQYGKRIAERFPIRYTQKYWTVAPEELSVEWIGNRMYRPELKEVLLGALTDKTPNTYYAKEMRYPTIGGYRSFLDPMASQSSIRTNRLAIRVDPKRKYVEFADSTKVYYQHLLSSIPLPQMINMIDDVPTNVKEAAALLWATSVALVSIGFNRPDVAKDLWFYIYDESILASRAYSPNLKAKDNVPEGCSSLQFEVYFSKYRPLGVNPVNLIEHIVESIEKMKLASRHDIVVTDYRVLPYGNVVFDHGMIERRNLVKAFLRSINIYPIGRFGEWDYLWSDQSLLSGKKAMEEILLEKKG